MSTPQEVWAAFGLLIVYGLVHGLSPHAHSWLVLLPLAAGGMKRGELLRLALSYAVGFILASAAAGALLGTIFGLIPEEAHHGIAIGVACFLVVSGALIALRPLTVHHAVNHICGAHCHTGEQRALVRTGTATAMFFLGVMSIVAPCPNSLFVYPLIASTASPLLGAALMTTYGIFTGVAILAVALSLSGAEMLHRLQKEPLREILVRVSGLAVAVVGAWMLSGAD